MKRHIQHFRRLAGGLLLYAALQTTTAVGEPIVNIEEPVSTQPLVLGQTARIKVSIQVGEEDTPITAVNVFANGSLLGPAAPSGSGFWHIDYTPPMLGVVTLRAEAIDSADPSETWVSDTFPFDVIQTDAPVVSILAPASNSRFLPGTIIPVQVLATDNDGLVQRVEFFLNGVMVDTVSSPPFRTEVQLPSIGDYILTARAFDNLGGQADSQEVNLIAGPPDGTTPRVVIDHPLPLGAGDIVNDVSYASATFLNARATDPDGFITNVRFYINGQLLGESGTNQRLGDVYSFFLDFNALGNYIISAEAIDNDGNSGWSVPLVLDVGPLERPLPKATMIQPFPESLLGRVVSLYVEADGGLIPIDRVDFFANGVFLGSVDEPVVDNLYSLNWVPQEPGDYDLQARVIQIDPAEATWDNWKIADPVSISIVEPPSGQEASIELINPVEGGEYTVLNPIALQANALDPLGSIVAVRFYANGRQLGEDESYPYSLSYSPPSPGLYQFVAEMESDRGFRLQSDPVTVFVAGSQLPEVSVTYPLDGAAISVGTPILITANTKSTGGGAMILDFYANGVFIGSDSTFPYRQIWAPQSLGTFELVVEAREPGTNVGVATSDQVRVVVNPSAMPTASITKPSGANPTVGSDVLIEVEAEDADGFVSSVEFFINGFSLGAPDLSKPFAAFWRPGSPGIYNISALVIDNSGNQVVTARNVTVGNPVGVVPRVTLSVTGSGNVTPGSRVVVGANVYDDDPDNLSVTFFMNGAQIGETDTQAPYSVIVDPEIGGGVFGNAYSLTAVVTDADGNSRADTLSPLYISDFSVNLPSIRILNISEGDHFTRGSRIPIRVEVSGGGAANLKNVVFYADGQEIGRVGAGEVSGRYSFDWVPERTGTVEITAAALLNEEFYDHDRDSGAFNATPRIPVTPVNVAFPVNILINEPVGILPSISLDIFPTRQNLAIGSRVMIYADAQDLDGVVEQVEFFYNGVSIGVDNKAPFTHILTTTSQGNFALNALATDSDGNVVTSTVVNLDVRDRVVTQTPSIILTVPASGQQGNPLSLRASTSSFVSGPESVIFYVNGQPVGEDTDFPYAYTWLANLTGTLTFFSTAQQTLFDGTIVTTVSGIVDSFLTENEPPVIDSFTVSFPGRDPIVKPNPALGDALTFRVSMTDSGPIDSVELLRDGESIKQSGNSSSPYEIVDFPPGTGTFQYSVLVTDRGGLQSQSGIITMLVQDRPGGGGGIGTGSLPVIQSFRSNVVGSSSLVRLPITFTVEASDVKGIERVELFQNGGTLVVTVFSEPYVMEFLPTEPGTYIFKATVTNLDGNAVNSEAITINVRQPDPLQQNTDFVYQTFLDLLMRTPTLEERNSFTGRIESGDLSRDRFIRELMNPSEGPVGEYAAVRNVLLTNNLLLGQWPTREELVGDVGTVKDGGLIALVSSLMSDFEPIYVNTVGAGVSGVPDVFSPVADIERYIAFLFQRKYGVAPNGSQMNLAKLHFNAIGRDSYTSSFISDVQILSTGSGFISLGLGFQFPLASPPSESYLREADGASLLINLLRITPSDEEVSQLSQKLFATQVSEVLADPRYAGRFTTAFPTLEHYPNSWKHSRWFGWFNTANPPWVYHAEQGWVYFQTGGQSAENFWYYDSGMGWMWTRDAIYPVVYEQAKDTWLMGIRTPYSPVEGRWFFDFGASDWIKR